MQRLMTRICLVSSLMLIILFGGVSTQVAIAASTPDVEQAGLCADSGQRIDLNNANLKAFTDCPGFYPHLASKIVTHGPYDEVEDVLSIPDLSERQEALLKANLDEFTVQPPSIPLEKRMPPRTNLPAH